MDIALALVTLFVLVGGGFTLNLLIKKQERDDAKKAAKETLKSEASLQHQ